MNENDYCRIEGRIDKKKVSYSGQIVDIKEDFIEIKTFDGYMGLPKEDEDFSITILKSKPKGWSNFIKNPKRWRNENREDKKDAPIIKTKKERIFDMVKENKGKHTKTLLKIAKKEIGGNDNILISYIEMAKNKI